MSRAAGSSTDEWPTPSRTRSMRTPANTTQTNCGCSAHGEAERTISRNPRSLPPTPRSWFRTARAYQRFAKSALTGELNVTPRANQLRL